MSTGIPTSSIPSSTGTETGNTIHVSNIAHNASELVIKEFFSFCGKIQDISITPSAQGTEAPLSATVTFEKATAAKTALLLDNSVLEGQPIKVEAAASLDNLSQQAEESAHSHDDDIQQEDKPRTTILAEYLAHGYHIGDVALQRGIDLDNKHGLSSKFTSYLSNLDNRFKVQDKTRAMDNTYNVSSRATDTYNTGYNTVARYMESALNTPTGQKVRDYYTQSTKQVLDIHAEARRIADLKKDQGGVKQPVKVGEKATYCTCGGSSGECGCPAGQCTCEGCSKHKSESSTASYGAPPSEKYA